MLKMKSRLIIFMSISLLAFVMYVNFLESFLLLEPSKRSSVRNTILTKAVPSVIAIASFNVIRRLPLFVYKIIKVIILVPPYVHAMNNFGALYKKLDRTETALRRLVPPPFSIGWLKSMDNLHHEANEVRYAWRTQRYANLMDLYLKLGDIIQTAKCLLGQGDDLLHPKDQLRGTMNFYMDKVLGFIEGVNSGMLGICGMGGVGKSSLLKLLSDSRIEYGYDSFKVLFVRAGIRCTVGQMQEAIATIMGLSLECSETSLAKTIHDHLEGTNFLLLIDDLLGYIDLKAVGIPSPLERVRVSAQGSLEWKARRKVVLTTRNMDLCDKMGCSRDNTIQMECFDEEEAWNLFRRGWPVRKVDVVDTLLPEKVSISNTSHSVFIKDKDVQLQRLEDTGISSYQKMCLFIEDKDANSRLLGIWGMRGVGKTTLLRLARDSYQCKAVFDHVLFVGAGTGHVVNNVQHAIAINLGLDLAMMSSMDEFSRAMCIFNYLEHKSFLLLLDDIREPLNWWAIGLPLLLRGQQKIILATRSQAACALMGCETVNTIEMQCLGGDGAWSLFRDKAGLGLVDNHPQVHHLAKQMVSICGGVPLALCSLGRAMSNKRDLREWRSAYSQLSAIGLEPCEIDEKVGVLIFNPPYCA